MITQVTRTKAAAIVVLSALGVGAHRGRGDCQQAEGCSKAGPTTDPIVVTVPTTEPESTLPTTVPDTVPETTAGDETTSTTPTTIAAQKSPRRARAGPRLDQRRTDCARRGVPTSATAPSRTAWRSEPRRCRPCRRSTTADYCAVVIAEKKGTTAGASTATETVSDTDKQQSDKENNGNGPPADRPGATGTGHNKP